MLMATSLKQQPPPFAGELEDGEFDDDEYIEHYTESIWSQRQDLLSLYTQQGHALQRDNAPSMQGLDATMLGDEAVPVDHLIEDWSADNMPPLPALPQKPVLRL